MIKLNKIKEFKSVVNGDDFGDNSNFYFKVDNRNLCHKSIFIAIVGTRFNPLEHLDKVVELDCNYVVCEMSDDNLKLVRDYKEKIHFIFVKDITEFIQEAGQEVSRAFRESGGKLVGISGSNGKTTTKEMLFDLLQREVSPEEIICTQKNNNNHLGVPFTLFQINENTKIGIVELGSNHPGEIEVLCKILNPQYGVTTNIGDTHLEFFENRENVFKEESVLKNYCSVFFQNMDDSFLSKLETGADWIQFGEAANINQFEFLKNGIKINNEVFNNNNITGKHNFINLGVSLLIAKEVLENSVGLEQSVSEFIPTSNRSEWIKKDDKSIFLDAYNANPSSMKFAVSGFFDHIDSIGARRESTLLVLGDMNELGRNADMFHEELGKYLREYRFGRVMFIGKYSSSYALGYGKSCEEFLTVLDATDSLRRVNEIFVFIKGSRSLQLETILDIR